MLGRTKQIPAIYLFLTVITLIAFWQVTQCDFINYDDQSYVTENVHIRNGITMEAMRWAFTTTHSSNWHPLTWMSHMLDVQLFGLKPRWHHLTNLLFHIANTLLLFFVFHRMTKAPWQSAFVAALFALHPLHVESVAWVAERKDVLSTFFWMLTMGAYIHYVENRPSPGGRGGSWVKNYSAVLVFFVLGLMAKPMLVTLPFVLLLLDYWPLQRFKQEKSAQEIRKEVNRPVSADKRKRKSSRKRTTSRGVELEEKPADHKYRWALIGPVLREKMPLFALAALSSIVTLVAEAKGGAVRSGEEFPPGVRIANAFVSYVIYIGKTIWPDNLAILYPHPGSWPLWKVTGAVVLLVAVTLTVIRTAKRFPYLTVGWLWFTGTLVPVIGIVQVGRQAMADRYTYIPLIGLFIMAAWGIPEFLKKWSYRKEILFASSALALLSLFIVTRIQVGYWQNSITLCDHALNVTNRNALIHNNRGVTYAKLGNYVRAISDYDRAIEIIPKYPLAYNNRGIAYDRLGNERQAISDFDRAIDIDPTYAEAYCNRGIAYGKLGNYRRAIEDFDRAIDINPTYADAYYNRGVSYSNLGNPGQAIEDLQKAARFNNEIAKNYLRSHGVNW